MTRGRASRPTWNSYVRRFHTERPGITEAVLSRCHHNGKTPYEWLTDTTTRDATVIDLACGSAPTRHQFGQRWFGIDASTDELAVAGLDTAGRAVAGDLARLPFPDASFEQAICSMALMIIDPLPVALAEIHRVLRPGAELRILLPTNNPLTPGDRLRCARLAFALGTSRLFPPTSFNHPSDSPLRRARFTVRSDERARFVYRIESGDDADLLIDSLYLPTPSQQHIAAAHRVATRWVGHEIGVPLRRIVASATPSSRRE